MAQSARLRCLKCGETAAVGDWETATHPTLGAMTQCPECGSTDVTSER